MICLFRMLCSYFRETFINGTALPASVKTHMASIVFARQCHSRLAHKCSAASCPDCLPVSLLLSALFSFPLSLFSTLLKLKEPAFRTSPFHFSLLFGFCVARAGLCPTPRIAYIHSELPKPKGIGLLASLANTCTKYLAILV